MKTNVPTTEDWNRYEQSIARAYYHYKLAALDHAEAIRKTSEEYAEPMDLVERAVNAWPKQSGID